MYRTHTCGQLRAANVNETVTLAGWVQKVRNLGAMTFIDLRDRYGITQIVVEEHSPADVKAVAGGLGREYVLQVEGRVVERSSKNPKMPTGDIEVVASKLVVLHEAEVPPFTIEENSDGGDDLRMKYRYLDLRRPPLQRNMILRHKMAQEIRRFLSDEGFLEIETPYLVNSTPEGARDFVVPSRMSPNQFYALPQSPQTLKQLLMVAGYDKYFQIVRCFRDEDLRADRQPEFTQVDMEMAFADENDIMALNEGLMKRVFQQVLGVELETPFQRLPYTEAMGRFGSDKPDTRFGLELVDVTPAVTGCQFAVFQNAVAAGGTVRAICVKGAAAALSRKEIDKLVEVAKTYGAKGLAYTRWTAEARSSSFEKFLTEEEVAALAAATGLQQGDVLLVAADADWEKACTALGAVRLAVGEKLGLIDKDQFNFLWVTDFPLFEYSEEEGRYMAKHHPFTMPREEDLDKVETDQGACRAKAYDMVLNGCEVGGGSIRINDPALQDRMFHALGFTEEKARESFGFLMDAYKYGAPPHGGMAYGFDRLVMLMLKKDSIRDVIAFPKVQNAGEPMSGCPETVEEKQLRELSIRLALPQE